MVSNTDTKDMEQVHACQCHDQKGDSKAASSCCPDSSAVLNEKEQETSSGCSCSCTESAPEGSSSHSAHGCCGATEHAHSCGCRASDYQVHQSSADLFTDEPVFVGMSVEQISSEILERLKSGGQITANEARWCMEQMPLEDLMELSHKVTSSVASKHVSLCSITNVKSGRCPQDCKWCAQSMHFKTGAEVYDVKSKEQCLIEARACYEKGVEMFSLVASGKKPSRQDFEKLLEVADYLRANVPIKLCASLGLLDEDMLTELKAHGIERYHCNLETAPSYFDRLVTRHTIKDKLNTLKAAELVGMELCSGGIIGMGENSLDRLELALALRELGIKSIPVNVLHPIEGTPLHGSAPLSDEEVLRAVSMFRLINPDAHLRFAGGRALLSDEVVNKAIYCGMNAAIVGDLLTTLGSDINSDRERFARHHYDLPEIPATAASGVQAALDSAH